MSAARAKRAHRPTPRLNGPGMLLVDLRDAVRGLAGDLEVLEISVKRAHPGVVNPWALPELQGEAAIRAGLTKEIAKLEVRILHLEAKGETP